MNISKIIVLVVIILATLNACTGDGVRTTTEGAVIGGIIGYLAGEEKGAAIGALIGASVGAVIAHRKNQYANTEALLDGEIAYASQVLEETQQINYALRQDIQQYNYQIAKLQKDIKRGNASVSALRKTQSSVIQKEKQATEALQAVDKEYNVAVALLKDVRAAGDGDPVKINAYAQKIAQLEQEKRALEGYVGELSAMSAAISI